jgi:D-alanyl-D-alanine endopeptidase (penicillin-binding protein 7)
VNRTQAFCVGSFALLSLIGAGAVPVSAAQDAQATTSAKKPAVHRASSTAKSTPKHTLYSADRSLSRKAKLARAHSIATAREMADTVLPRYKVDASGELVPDVRAAAAIIYDPETNHVLFEENSQTPRSIASITKVMTATVFLENNPDLSAPITIERSDVFQASTTFLHTNDKLTVDDVLHLMLIASDNAAARALARTSPYGSGGFVARMNEKAAELGLENTRYADPSGLLSDNVSSAYDMAKLITHASGDDRIASVMRLQEYTVRTAKNRAITFHSTDHLLGRDGIDVRAAKTGFISKAGYCLATLLRLPQPLGGQQVAVVVLGARSNAGRFMETQNLFNWLSTKADALFAKQPIQQQ